MSGRVSQSVHLVASPEVRTAESDDGTVLLNARSGTYHALNPVAALIWRCLREGEERVGILRRLEEQYPEVEPDRLVHDLDALLARLLRLGMVVRADRLPHRDPGETATAVGPAAVSLPPVESVLAAQLAEMVREPGPRPTARLCCLAWLGLVIADVLLRGLGYRRCMRFFHGRPVQRRKRSDATGLLAVCAAVDTAARLYFRNAWCLQRSAVTCWLLRRRGLPAELVIGVRKLPFMAHAWVVAGDLVLNDDPQVASFFEEISRL